MTAPPAADHDMGRLRWRCRRGMRELDRLLGGWLEREYRDATAAEQQGFRDLLDLQDPELYGYFLGRLQPDCRERAALIERIARAAHCA